MEQIFTNFTLNDVQQLAALGLAGFVLALIFTPIYTNIAFKEKWWKRPRQDAMTGEKAVEFNKLHKAKHKRHIPTMAGLIFVFATVIITILFNLDRAQTLLPLTALLGAAWVGLLDDIINLRGSKGVAGLTSKVKFALISLVALVGGAYFHYKLGYDAISIPFFESSLTIGGIGIILLFTLVVVSTANAVNISDGLDGLSGGLLTSAFATYTAIALLQGNIGIAGFCATIVGTLQAYTWFNIYPARFFMGDVGSFSLGAALGVVAMLTGTVVLLPIIAGVFVLEAGSSLIQVLSKRYLGRKIFKVAPLHHHFEALGWPETKVTMRFWVVGQVFGLMGLVIGLVGGVL
ncbi:TPA: phospho-N-acetylmuramoyl-pentapeptide-transferase [Candidatus Saccharibacteria bacterium]|nr:phospho-N-acetylmuramoyl-pentapeptide-transferase [Candidatus Saccharibacteria bacterium]HIO87580.1 phospho-N-acetylmuramoyl-pentapeptide-transferase [Candidatus Saccharibacteria bacterium]